MASPEGYGGIAAEYYDVRAHPTSANLRAASLSAITSLLPQHGSYGAVCELGAGRSVFLDLPALHDRVADLVLVDLSEKMIEYSVGLARARFVVADAAEIAFSDRSFDLVVASLGDPYNTPEVWSNVYRLLRPSGLVIYTGPSIEWATRFRTSCQDGRLREADFSTRHGERAVPSYVRARDDQVSLWAAQRLAMQAWVEIFPASLQGPLSPKIIERDAPFCIGALGRKDA